ncbi:MAG: hypothetical protein RL015_184 [Verrucomicrobiota bacterium]|jgi:hypothetical protein
MNYPVIDDQASGRSRRITRFMVLGRQTTGFVTTPKALWLSSQGSQNPGKPRAISAMIMPQPLGGCVHSRRYETGRFDLESFFRHSGFGFLPS